MDKIPLSLLQTQTRKFGARLFKPPRKPTAIVYVQRDLHYPATTSGFGGYVDLRIGKDFRNADFYLFYSSGCAASAWSMCRACQTICWGEADRKFHMISVGCDKFIWKALGRLRADKRCAVCESEITIQPQVYGVWLCCTACTNNWKFSEKVGRTSLEEALRLEGFKDGFEGN